MLKYKIKNLEKRIDILECALYTIMYAYGQTVFPSGRKNLDIDKINSDLKQYRELLEKQVANIGLMK